MATEDYLKKESGEFDLESIAILDLSNQGLSSVGSLSLCSQLCVLNLSLNKLTSVSGLATLVCLEWLDLSANQIVSLDGLDKLESLNTLNLAGNSIASMDSLFPLSSLCELRRLTLHTSHTPLTNPLCSEASYKEFRGSPRSFIPSLDWLDDELVDGEFHMAVRVLCESGVKCEEVDQTSELIDRKIEKLHNPLDGFSLEDHMTATTGHMQSEDISGLVSQCKVVTLTIDQEIQTLHEQLTATSQLT